MSDRTFARATRAALALHGIKIVEVAKKARLPYSACTRALSGAKPLSREDHLRLLKAAAEIADARRAEDEP